MLMVSEGLFEIIVVVSWWVSVNIINILYVCNVDSGKVVVID